MSEILIRTATIADVLPLRDLSRSTFYETYADQNTPDDIRLHMQQTFSIEKLTSEIEDPGNAFFLACKSEQIIGYAKLRTSVPLPKSPSSNAIEIERIYVTKTSQGQNAGGALMDSCIAYAKDNGFDIIWLGVWERNTRAITFYEKWGFRATGTQMFVLGKDMQNDVVMTREIRKREEVKMQNVECKSQK